ncbi:putative ribonuclease H-like domain-containing protein [Tanacetum coccineum]
MAFISSSNTSSGKSKVPTASVQTASVQVSTASTDIVAASLSHDTVCAFIATQPNGSQIKYEDITQIDDDDIEEMDIKWNLALLSMRADRWNALIDIRWVILLENAEHQEVKTEEREKATRGILRPTIAADLGNKGKAVKASARWIWKPKQNTFGQGLNFIGVLGIPQDNIDDKGYWDSGCSRQMTGNISYLSEYEPYEGGYVSFGHGGGKITSKGIIKTGKLEFENVYFVKELKYNLFIISQISDNKNSVLFTDSKSLVLGKDFKIDDSHVLIRTPRQYNMHSIDLNNIVPHKNLTCLIAKAFVDESMLWDRRLGHLNFKTMNKLVRNNLVKGLPSKSFENDHTCVACLKGKQHKDSCKTKLVNSVSKPLHTWYMDLFGPTSVSSLNQKWYCLVVTDDFSRTPQKNGVAKRRNRTLIEAARTMLADAKLPVTFGLKQLALLVISHAIGFLRPFGCHVMILNTLDHLGKFDAKGDEGYFVGYSLSSKAFRVFNKRTKKVEENLHVDFLENKPIEKGAGPNWLFDIDTLTNSMNYVPIVVAGTSSTNISGTKEDAHQAVKENVSSITFIALPNWFHEAHMETSNDSIRNSEANDDSHKEQDGNTDVSENSGNTNPTATSNDHTTDQVEPILSSTVETGVPTVSSQVPTASTNESSELPSSLTVETAVPTVNTHVPTSSKSIPPITSSLPRIISRGGSSYQETPSLGNAIEDIFGDTTDSVSLNEVEADLSNMETII